MVKIASMKKLYSPSAVNTRKDRAETKETMNTNKDI